MIVIDEQYVLWTKGLNLDRIEIICVDKYRQIYQGIIERSNRPKTRANEPTWLESVERALTSSNLQSIASSSVQYDISITDSSSSGSVLSSGGLSRPQCLDLIVKESIAGNSGKMLLLKVSLLNIEEKSDELHFSMLKSLNSLLSEKNRTIHQLRDELESSTSEIEKLTDVISRAAEYKDKLQDDLVLKICLLLNQKKQEINRLREFVDRHAPRASSLTVDGASADSEVSEDENCDSEAPTPAKVVTSSRPTAASKIIAQLPPKRSKPQKSTSASQDAGSSSMPLMSQILIPHGIELQDNFDFEHNVESLSQANSVRPVERGPGVPYKCSNSKSSAASKAEVEKSSKALRATTKKRSRAFGDDSDDDNDDGESVNGCDYLA